MTFDEAMKATRGGKFIRHPHMGPGWTISSLPKFPGEIWCLNPHTGSEYAYTAKDADKKRDDWYVVKDRIDAASLKKGS